MNLLFQAEDEPQISETKHELFSEINHNGRESLAILTTMLDEANTHT